MSSCLIALEPVILYFFLDLFLELEEIGIKGILKTLSKYYILGIFWEDRL